MSERLIEAEHQEPRRRARSGGSRATSATTGSSEDGSSGQHADYDTEVYLISSNILDAPFLLMSVSTVLPTPDLLRTA